MKKVCVFLADGFEEIEGLTVVDILRRAGIDTETVSVMGRKQINVLTVLLLRQTNCLRKQTLRMQICWCCREECRAR